MISKKYTLSANFLKSRKVGDSFTTSEFCRSLSADGVSWDNAQHYLKEFAKMGYLKRVKVGTYEVAYPFWDLNEICEDVISKVETHYKATKEPYVVSDVTEPADTSDTSDTAESAESTESAEIDNLILTTLIDMGIDPAILPEVTDKSSLSFKSLKKTAGAVKVSDITEESTKVDEAEAEVESDADATATTKADTNTADLYANGMLKSDGFMSNPFDFSQFSANVLLADYEALKYLTNHFRSIHDKHIPTYASIRDKIGSMAFRLPLIYLMYQILTELKNRYPGTYALYDLHSPYDRISAELQSYGFL